MLQKMRSSRDIGRKVSPPQPQPVFMSEHEKCDYLSKLRKDRPVRPAGSRPLPSKSGTHPSPTSAYPPTQSASALSPPPQEPEPLRTLSDANGPPRSGSTFPYGQLPSTAAFSGLSIGSRTTRGRPLAKDPSQISHSVGGHSVSSVKVEPHARSSSNDYRESGARWMERQEAKSLREALQAMDQQTEDQRIHTAAQKEAAALVWEHRNPDAARRKETPEYANPDVYSHGRHRFTAHLQKGAYSRSQQIQPKGAIPTSPTLKGSSPGSNSFPMANNIDPLPTSTTNPANKQNRPNGQLQDDRDPSSIGINTKEAVMKFSRRKSSGQRKISNGSSKSGFPNPHDQIYEDSGDLMPPNKNAVTTTATATALSLTNHNPQVRGSRPLPGQPVGSGRETEKPIDRFEIQRNPPSQSRSAGYTQNTLPRVDVVPEVPEVPTPPHKDGLEIRGEDIRAATSMRLKDRSRNLPCPTAVSDHRKRPIVSFDIGWKPDTSNDNVETERPSPKPAPTIPAVTVSAPVVPSINVLNVEAPSGPAINAVEDKSIPAISIQNDEPSPSRPLPQPSKTTPGKPPTTKSSSRLPWLSPSSRAGVPTAKCANCALPISGRIVTASGSGPSSSSLKALFHPECFTCHHCSTALECVAFYPEPEDRRLKRLEASGGLSNHLGDDGVMPESELRFYCHLDFHEFFSPRCRSCKTPIEGEVIVAAGAEWHVGHFFCSECGDPFDSNTPFVEKDNYAYCVSCHTRRTSARCRACKKQILEEMTVQALGAQWHAECFNCFECGGGFGAEGRFFIRDVRVEGTDKEKRRGIATKMEEKAVCKACEERRLKA